LWEAFDQFAAQATSRVVNWDDEPLRNRTLSLNPVFYGLESGSSPETGATFQARNIEQEIGMVSFDHTYFGQHPQKGVLHVPGVHNVSNSMAALWAAMGLFAVQNTDFPKLLQSLKTFAGTLRRFELKGEAGGVLVYDDYGHHPTEVEKTLEAARDFLGRRLVVIFQPHRYSRTAQLGSQFGPSFAAADYIVITQLYSAFEEPIPGVSGKIVFDAVKEAWPDKPVVYAETLDEAKRLALQAVRPGDALFTFGAGDITKLGPQLLQELEHASSAQ
jgi:UDP-N-acetylmuramate--alanine ligase